MSQDQKGGDSAVNIQAGGNVVVGPSYEDVRQMALDVYKANALELGEIAKRTAYQRAEEITGEFIQALHQRNPEGIQKSKNPDFQYALFDAQKAYARTGDKQLAKVLTDLLVQRTKENSRSLREIALDECMHVVPKLTPTQIDIVSLLFVLRYTSNTAVVDRKSLSAWCDRYLKPFVHVIPIANATIQHLVYSSVATVEMGSIQFDQIFRQTYPFLFVPRFALAETEALEKELPGVTKLFSISPESKDERVPVPFSKMLLKTVLSAQLSISEDLIDKFWERIVQKVPDAAKVEQILIETNGTFGIFIREWNKTSLAQMTLTSVGLALGHANFCRLTGEQAPLSIWIPD